MIAARRAIIIFKSLAGRIRLECFAARTIFGFYLYLLG